MRYKERELKGNPFHPNPVLDRLYRRRGVDSMAELDYNLSTLLPPDMKGMDEAVDLLVHALRNQERMIVVGDYDCDGATATTIAVEGLRMMGAEQVSFMVPDRFTLGYGLSPGIAEVIAPQKPDLVITVDNGIAAIEGAQAIKNLEHPTKLLITDHHLAPEEVPEAEAIVNPNQHNCPFPSKALAGCGVMFYVLTVLRTRLRKEGYFEEKGMEVPDLRELLDVLALGTVADVVPLDKNNRTIVYQGLKRINAGKVRPGIKALLELGKREIGKIVASDFGFIAGPRINSAGRLEDMSIGIACLLEKDEDRAWELARRLDKINSERKEIQNDMIADAMEAVESLDLDGENAAMGFCVYKEDFHEGIVGLVASRLKEQLFRPVIVFAKTDSGEDEIKGSGRSVNGVHLRDVLCNVNAKTGLIKKFGGHAMAAGLSIARKDLEAFQKAFDEEVRCFLTKAEGLIETDGELQPQEITLETAQTIRQGGPWGQMFPDPIFEGKFRIVERRVVGSNHLKMKVAPLGGGRPVDAIAFNIVDSEDVIFPEETIVRMAYILDINEWKGRVNVQFLVQHIESTER